MKLSELSEIKLLNKIRNVNKWLFYFAFFYLKSFYAQDTLPENKFTPSITFYSGVLPKTYPIAPASRYAFFSSISLNWQVNGKDKWHQLYAYPSGGIDVCYGSFDNPSELGYTFGLVPTLILNSPKESKFWRAKIGFGAAYFNKPYNAVSNASNYYVGANFANLTFLSLFWKKKINKDLYFSYGGAIAHSSNGHTRLPNVGLNLLLLNAGLEIGSTNHKHHYDIEKDKGKLSYATKFGVGMHEFGAMGKAIGGPNYPSYHFSFWVSKSYKNIHLLQAGFTLAYYTSFRDYITSQSLYDKSINIYSSTALIFGGHEFVFGKFSLSTQMGLYVFNPFFIKQKKLEGTWDSVSEKLEAFNSNRLGLIYYPFKKRNTLNNVKNQLMLGAFIKANLAQADLFEYSIGYVF
jgi:hypothetical protein